MSLEKLFPSFELFAESPVGIAKLREAILDMAVTGALSTQEKNDDDSTEFLDRIASVRDALAEADKVKLPNPKSKTIDDSKLNGIPSRWGRSKLGLLCTKMGAGSTPLGGREVYRSEGVAFLRSQNVWDDGPRMSDVARIPASVHEKMAGTHVRPGDMLLNITGASIGRSAVVPKAFEPANVSQHVAIIRLTDESLTRFLHLCIISPDFQRRIMDVQVGVSREGLSMTRLKEFVVPIPPLAEQKRIVAKVDQLMGLCDRLEAQQQEREAKHTELTRAALARFHEHPRPGNLNLLFHKSFTIPPADLRKTILQLAVQGKLTQVATEETGEMVKVGDVVDFLGGYAFKSEWFKKSGGIRLARNQNIGHGRLNWSDTEYLPRERAEKFDRFRLRPGDLVLSLNRPFISTGLKLAWVREPDCPCLLVQRVACMRPKTTRLIAKYLYLWCNAPHFYRNAHVVPSSGVPYIATNRVARMSMLLPSLSNQKRIVDMVESLLKQLDRLEAELSRSQATAGRLMEAIVAQ
jgi:type I restriction enzyme, S subunit